MDRTQLEAYGEAHRSLLVAVTVVAEIGSEAGGAWLLTDELLGWLESLRSYHEKMKRLNGEYREIVDETWRSWRAMEAKRMQASGGNR